MKIAHLSDLHVCIKNKPENLVKTRHLIEYALEQQTDHFLVTGDLTSNAETKDFIALRNLFNEYQILDTNRLSLVPGNHDIYGGVYLAEDILTFPKKCKTLDLQKKTHEFNNIFFEAFENIYSPIKDEIYPFGKKIGNVVLLGLNSIIPYSIIKNPFASRGLVSKAQVAGLQKILTNPKFEKCKKLVLMHHYFGGGTAEYSMKEKSILHRIESYAGRLRQKSKLVRSFAKMKVDLVLHGHLHESFEYWRQGLHFLNAGGAVEKNQPDELKINLITIDKNQIFTEIKILSKKRKSGSMKHMTHDKIYSS